MFSSLPKDRHLLRLLSTSVGAVLWGSLLLGYYALFHVPLHRHEDEQLARIADLRVLLHNNTNVHTSHRTLREAMHKLQNQITEVRQRIPGSPLEGEFLSEATRLALEEQIIIETFHRQNMTTFSDYSEVDVVLQGRGSYASICRFLFRVSELDRMSTVRSMTIERDGAEDSYPFKVVYSLQYGIKTDLGTLPQENPR